MARAREVFRTRATRPFVIYTIVREERSNGAIVRAGTYAERVWFRARDGIALARRMEDGVVTGPMIAEKPTLDGDVDPGPPTADIFEPGPASARATPAPGNDSGLAVLATVAVRGEFDYRAFPDGREDGATRLRLEPRRDPDRNRLRELWIDRETGIVTRFVMRDRIYFAARTGDVPVTFEFRGGVANGVPAFDSIASVGDDAAASGGPATLAIRYHFEDVSFPASLPDWYFDAYVHSKHLREAPNR